MAQPQVSIDPTGLTTAQIQALLAQVTPTPSTSSSPSSGADPAPPQAVAAPQPVPVQQVPIPAPQAPNGDGYFPSTSAATFGSDPTQPFGHDDSVGHMATAQIKAILAANDAYNAALEQQKAQQAYEQSHPGYDMAHALLPSLAKGAAGVIGLPGDLINAYGNLKDRWDNATDNFFDGTHNPAPAFTDYAHPLDSLVQAMGGKSTGLPTTSQDFNNLVQNATGSYYQPQTMAGRAVDTLGQMAPAALLPAEGLLTRAARVVVPAATSDAAGEVTRAVDPNDPHAEALARGIGGFVGGGLQGGAESIANAPAVLAAKSLKGVSSDQLDLMQALMERAQAKGVQLTPAEALTQVGAGRLAPLQHYVENSHVGGAQVSDFFAQRPGQVSSAVNAFVDQIAPATGQPSMIGQAAQTAAQGGLNDVRQTINGIAKPAYDALPTQTLPDADYAPLAQGAAYQAALKAVRSNPILNEPIAGLPDNNLAVINEVKKQIGQSVEANAQSAVNPSGNNQVAASYGNAGALADALARAASPDWAAAHDIVSGGRVSLLDPLAAGPAGKIAATDQVPAQTAALYPAKPLEGTPNETAQALRLMATQDPQVGADLTRQHLMNTFNEASQNLIGGQNQYGGAKWISQIVGNPEQRATLLSGLQTVNPAAANQFQDLADVLEATGKRMQPGSQTAFNEERQHAFSMSPTPLRTLAAVVDPLEWGKALDHAVGGAMYRRNLSALADMLTSSTPAQAKAFLTKAQTTQGGQAVATAAEGARTGSNGQ